MRAIGIFFVTAWGILMGAICAGMFIGITNHPVGVGANLISGCMAGLFSTMGCLGLGRFINEQRFGKILNAISCATIGLVFVARIAGWLPV
jgi:hypothetical protein